MFTGSPFLIQFGSATTQGMKWRMSRVLLS